MLTRSLANNQIKALTKVDARRDSGGRMPFLDGYCEQHHESP